MTENQGGKVPTGDATGARPPRGGSSQPVRCARVLPDDTHCVLWAGHSEGHHSRVSGPFELCVKCGGTDDLMDRAMAPGMTFCGPCRRPVAGRGPLTIVTWEDTTNVAAWLDPAEVATFATDGGWCCQNVGWVTYEDEDCIVLSARLAADDESHVGLTERIPKRAIMVRRDIEQVVSEATA